MKKIVIFYGSDRAYAELIPAKYRNLSDVAMQMDDDSKRMELWVKGIPQQEEPKKEKKAKIKIENFVIFADEYSSVNEHVIINFIDFLGKLSPTNMYIQNPPVHLLEQIYRVYGDKNIIQEKRQDYEVITEKSIVTINNDFDNRIIGQNAVKQQLLKAIFPVMNNAQDKPVVILFYGNSGLGKTETAQFLTETIGGKMLRKQFSMYQNNEFANYLFGGKYNEKSFAKDLVSRDANVILLDEFDKANPLFHSAFYQLFDEGIFEDQNYKVDVKHAVIICTSNYQSKDEVKEKLGIPIYNRFDAVIRFDELSNEAKMLIANKELNELDSSKVLSDDIHNDIIKGACRLENAREIRKLIKDTISLYQIRRICQKSSQECEN
jgi:ATP-dependent Clp protease ATP-binding subunit ClpA